jgi:hypothetical protein
MENLEHFLQRLKTTAWRTSCARFNAARRLKRRDGFATFSIAFFSALSVGVSIIPRIYALPTGSMVENHISTLSIFIGIFVIIISLIEWAANSQGAGEKLYENAKKLNAFSRKLDQFIATNTSNIQFNKDDVTFFREEYESIIASCPLNHLPIDDLLFLVAHRKSEEFLSHDKKPRIGLIKSWYILLKGLLADTWFYAILWLTVSVILLMIFTAH